jgi:hypothetical protein
MTSPEPVSSATLKMTNSPKDWLKFGETTQTPPPTFINTYLTSREQLQQSNFGWKKNQAHQNSKNVLKHGETRTKQKMGNNESLIIMIADILPTPILPKGQITQPKKYK